jgi:hypothetical protein
MAIGFSVKKFELDELDVLVELLLLCDDDMDRPPMICGLGIRRNMQHLGTRSAMC